MRKETYLTPCGSICYWVNHEAEHARPQLVFLPGLTADHRLFEKQIACFEKRYPVFVWDAPGHAASWPFQLTFSLMDQAKWLDEILAREGFDWPLKSKANQIDPARSKSGLTFAPPMICCA